MKNLFFTSVMTILLGVAGYLAYWGSIPPIPSPRRDHQSIEAYLARLRLLVGVRKNDLVVPKAALSPLALPNMPPLPEVAPGRENPFL